MREERDRETCQRERERERLRDMRERQRDKETERETHVDWTLGLHEPPPHHGLHLAVVQLRVDAQDATLAIFLQ